MVDDETAKLALESNYW